MSTTKITTSVSCGSATSPGLDINPKEGVMLLHYSFRFGKGKVENVDIALEAGDTGEEISKKVAEKVGQMNGGSNVRVSRAKREEKKQRQGGEVVTTVDDEFTITISGASHVDAASNCQGKVKFDGKNYNENGGGVTVMPPPWPMPPRPGPKPEMNPGTWPKWKSVLDVGLMRPVLGEATIPDHWKKSYQSPGPPEPPTWPPRGGLFPEGSAPEAGDVALGMLLVGAEAESRNAGEHYDILRIPFVHIHSSPVAQVDEWAMRLSAAGVECVNLEGVLVPVTMPDGERPVRCLGFIESVEALPQSSPFPWAWLLWPEASVQGLERESKDRGLVASSSKAVPDVLPRRMRSPGLVESGSLTHGSTALGVGMLIPESVPYVVRGESTETKSALRRT